MKFAASSSDGEFKKAMEGLGEPMALAATAAVKEAAETARREGRANIGAAGFSTRWQNALVANVYPNGPGGTPSIDAAAVIRHRIPFAGVFEEGATIHGKPLLWLPLPTVPAGQGGRRLSPKQYAQQFGRLRSVNRPGKRPLLVGPARGGKSVPLFVGVNTVTIRKRFRIIEIVQKAASRLGDLYAKHLKVD